MKRLFEHFPIFFQFLNLRLLIQLILLARTKVFISNRLQFSWISFNKLIICLILLQSNMISQNSSVLFDQGLNQSIILRKNIKVKSSRLPFDFFNNNQSSRYQPRRISLKKSIAEEYTRETYTPSFERLQDLSINSPGLSLAHQRKIGTARVNVNKDDTLINDVINTTRNIKRVFRRKSLEMVRQSYQRQQLEIHLPKIKNPRRGNHQL